MWMAASGVHRMQKRWPLWAKAILSTTAATVAGVIVGGLLGWWAATVKPATVQAITVIWASVIVVCLLSKRPLLQIDRETSQSLLHKGPAIWSIANGGLLGLGFTSRLGYWVWYLLPLTAWASASFPVGATVWGTYGATRLLTTALIARRMAQPGSDVSTIATSMLKLHSAATRAMRGLGLVVGVALALIAGLL